MPSALPSLPRRRLQRRATKRVLRALLRERRALEMKFDDVRVAFCQPKLLDKDRVKRLPVFPTSLDARQARERSAR